MTDSKVVICPYCGQTQAAGDQCGECGGLYDALSRQATHNEMGPWFVFDRQRPHRPGCSYETLARLVERDVVTKYSIVRGPTSKQFWTVARRVPGVAHLLGYCHACDARVQPTDHGCPSCGVPFGAYLDRNHLGLPEVRPLPWEAPVGPDGDRVRSGGGMHAGVATAPASTGLSSFAADDELLGTGPGPREPTPAYAPAPGPGAWEATATTSAGDRPAAYGQWMNSPVVRSMQRRLARQERTIRMLTVLVLLVAIGGAASAVVIAQRAGRGEVAAPGPATALPIDAASSAPTGIEADADGRTAAETADRAIATPTVVDTSDAASPAETPVVTSPERDRALTLVTRAEETTRTIDERIDDYDAALALLRPLAAAATDDAVRVDLEALVTRIEDAVERLTLRRDFFGGSDGATEQRGDEG